MFTLGALHHLGYLTESLESGRVPFMALGYAPAPEVADDTQKARLQLLYRPQDQVAVELVEPYPDNQALRKLLGAARVMPYHQCFACPSLAEALEILPSSGFVPLSQPVTAPALEGRSIVYFYHRLSGYLELVEYAPVATDTGSHSNNTLRS